jgi:protein ImuB
MTASMAAPQRRPTWLLPRPVRLETVSVVGSAVDQTDMSSGPPVWFCIGAQRHEVVKAHGPERIETAWWRGPTVRRDYYVVETSTGARYWIFRRLRGGSSSGPGFAAASRLGGEWFLHGTFS